MRNDTNSRDVKAIVERIRLARRRKKITQFIFSQQMGVSQGTVARWETAVQFPSYRHLEQIAKVLGVEFSWLMGATDEINEAPRIAFANPAEPQPSIEVFRVALNSYFLSPRDASPEDLARKVRESANESHIFPNGWMGESLPLDAVPVWVYVGHGVLPSSLSPNDRVLVNLADRSIRDGLWLLDLGGGPALREIHFVAGGMVSVSAQGCGFTGSPKDLDVYGRVVLRITQV